MDSLWDSAIALERLVTTFGWDARRANSAAEALRTAGVFHPQVVLISLAPGEELWLALAQRLRAEMGETLRLIGLTTASPRTPREGAPVAFDAVLQKPLQMRDVEHLSEGMRRQMPDLVFAPWGAPKPPIRSPLT